MHIQSGRVMNMGKGRCTPPRRDRSSTRGAPPRQDIRYFFVTCLLFPGYLSVKYSIIYDSLGDFFTKSLQESQFSKLPEATLKTKLKWPHQMDILRRHVFTKCTRAFLSGSSEPSIYLYRFIVVDTHMEASGCRLNSCFSYRVGWCRQKAYTRGL